MNDMTRLVPARPATVGVIQTSSERDHNSDAGPEVFAELELDWVSFEFFDEHSIGDLLRGVAERRFSAICFGSNSLFNPVIHAATQAAAAEVAAASEAGMGIVISLQFLPSGSERKCDFLSASHRLEYRGCGERRIEGLELIDDEIHEVEGLGPDQVTFGKREPVMWSDMVPVNSAAWRPLVRARTTDGDQLVLMRTRSSHGRVIASALHIDWIADRRLLRYAVMRAIRATGTLYVHPPDEDAVRSIGLQLLLGRAVARGNHLSAVAVWDPASIVSNEAPFKEFSNLVVSDRWGWPEMRGLLDGGLRGRLENGGSVTVFSGEIDTDGKVLATVSGRPLYLQLADQFAAWFDANQTRFKEAPTTQVRALAVAAEAISQVTVDPDEIPRLLGLEELSRIFDDYFKRRLRNTDNVDGHALPTASLASAMRLLRCDEREIEPLIQWLRRDDFISSYAAVQQAALWLDDVDLATRSAPSGSDLEAIYENLLSLRGGSATAEQIDDLFALLINDEVPLTRKAIVAESLVRHGDAQTFAMAATAAMSLQNDLEHEMDSERASLEVVCLLTAFIVRVHAAQELTAGGVHFDANGDVRQPDLESDRGRELDLVRGELSASLERLEQTRRFGSRAVGWAVTLGLALTVGVAALLIAILGASWTAWIAISVPAVTAVLATVSYVGHRAKEYESEPRMLAELREIWRP